MAKITIVGDAVVITSSLKLEDIQMVQKYRPSALILKGGEDGKKPIFHLGAVESNGGISKYGADFDSETRDDEKLATMTMIYHGDGDIKEDVAESIGMWVMTLNKLEETIPQVIEEIRAEKERVLASITVVG